MRLVGASRWYTQLPFILEAVSIVRRELRPDQAVIGFCGGYTTFSTAMADTVRLVRDGPAAAWEQILQSLANLRTFPFVAEREARGDLALHGAWFDISTGELWVMDGESGDFVRPDF